MDSSTILYDAHQLVARAGTTPADPSRPPIYKVIGLSLAIASGLFIGTSFVLKKIGLLRANEKYNEEAGEGYAYLKNAYWWSGMTLMIVGEICNFVAYAFVDAILVTPLGALSVVVTTILSAIFLKERLSFVGKVGCFSCIVGSVVIVLNAPEQSAVADIQEMQHFVIAPGFLTYAGIVVVGSAFTAFWVAPRYGKKSMLVYLSICSFVGGLSVVATQGLGSAIVAQAGGKPQFNQWFLYVLLVLVVATLLTEIVYLNKALNLFNAALVTPTYYVIFTSATILTSAILFRGFHGTAISITTVIMGFLQICAGVVLLQLSKSAKDVPDAAVFKGDLDQVREVAEQEQSETDPKADAIRGAAALVRRFSSARQTMEQREFERLRQEKAQHHLEPLRENEIVEWDGLRRRKTIIGDSNPGSPMQRRRTIHPPLGMSSFPLEDENEDSERAHNNSAIFDAIRARASSMLHIPGHRNVDRRSSNMSDQHSPTRPVPLTNIEVHPTKAESPAIPPYGPGSLEEAEEHIFGLPAGLRKSSKDKKPLFSPRSKPLPPKPEPSPSSVISPPQSARRQFSFTNFMHRGPKTPVNDGNDDLAPPSRAGLASRGSSFSNEQKKAMKNATEEERLGLVKGDSHRALLDSSPERLPPFSSRSKSSSLSSLSSSSSPSLDGHHGHDTNERGRLQRRLSNSDSDDDWQMTDRPTDTMTTNAAATATAIVTATTRARQTQNSSSTSYPASRASSKGSRKRPSPPRNYPQQPPVPILPPPQQVPQQQVPAAWPLPAQPAIDQQLVPAPLQGQQSISSKKDVKGSRVAQIRDQEVGQVSARQAVDRTDPSQILSTSRYQSPATIKPPPRKTEGDVGRVEREDEGRDTNRMSDPPSYHTNDSDKNDEEADTEPEDDMPSRRTRPVTLYSGQGWGSPMNSADSPEMQQEQSQTEMQAKTKFKEQSRKEREKRRSRLSIGGPSRN